MEKLDTVRRIDYIRRRLYQKQRITIGQLARETGTCWRTIHRDIDYLLTQMPLDVKRGKGGGVLYTGEFRPDMFVIDELKALNAVLEHETLEPEVKMLIEGVRNKIGGCLPND